MKKLLLFLIAFVSTSAAFSQAPTTQAANVQITYKTTTAATITWTRGNGAACMVMVKKLSSTYAGPASSTTTNYSASATYGNGTSLGNSDNYVVYEGTGTSVSVNGLTENTTYLAYVYEYNSGYSFPSAWFYYQTSTSSASFEAFNTLQLQPTGASSVTWATSSYNSATIYSSTGTGASGRLMYLKQAAAANAYPVDGYSYTASTVYGSGANLGGGGSTVYSSTGTSITVTNLLPATQYYAYSHAYNDGNYSTSATYALNSRNYYLNSTYYSFYTANYPPTISFYGASNSSICQDVSWQSFGLTGITDGSVDENQTVTLSASSNNTTLIPNGNISVTYNASTGNAIVYYIPAAGQYGSAIISITANDGFITTPTTTINFTVTVNPKPLTAGIMTINGNTGVSTVPFCGGTDVTASISAVTYATGYNWTLPAGCSIISGANTNSITVSTPTVSTITNYTLIGTPTNSCGNGTAATRVIQVDPNPTTPNAGADQINLCGGTAFLNANSVTAPNVGNWETPIGIPAASISSSSSAATSIIGLGGIPAATYQCVWTVNYTGSTCPAKHDTVVLTTDWSHPSCQPSANFNFSPASDVSSSTVCVGTQINFTDLSISANSWQWDFNYTGTPNFTSTIQNPSYTYNTAGTYSVFLKIFSNATSQYYNITKQINVIGAPSTPGMIFGTTSGICANSPNQYAYSIASVNNATNYNWTTPTGANIVANPSSTSAVLMFANNALPGNLSVNASNSCGTSTNSNLMLNISPLPVMPGIMSGPTSACQGEQNVSLSVPSITYATSYEWTLLNGSQISTASPSYSYDIGLNEISGRVYVKGVNSCGEGDSADFVFTINPLPANAGGISGNTLLNLCPVANAEVFSVSPVANATNYTWNLSAGSIAGGSGTDAITVDFTGVTGNVTIQAIPSNACGVRDSTPVFNVSFNAVPMVDICSATVDSTSQHNEIYWVRPLINGISGFKIYRKLTALQDTLVGTVPYANPTVITDTLNDYNPNSNFEEYTITAIDSCGNESQKSPYHRTMFLSTSLGTGTINLNWNLYIGQTVNFYQIYRDTVLGGSGQWDLLDGMVNPSVTTWVDNAPHPNGRYKVEVDWLTSCDPTRGAINTSRSNIKSPTSIGIKEKTATVAFRLYPNPTNDLITLATTEKGKHTVTIIDALGKVVYIENIDLISNEHVINVSSLTNGVYFVFLSNEKGKTAQRLIKQ